MDFGSFVFEPASIVGLVVGVYALGLLAGGVAALVMSAAGRGRSS